MHQRREPLPACGLTIAIASALIALAPPGRLATPAHAAGLPMCPSAVGGYELDAHFSIEAPEVGSLECSYGLPDGDVSITAG